MAKEPTAEEWALALKPDERIIWMGQPSGKPKTDGTTRFLRLFGAIFFAFGSLFFVLGFVIPKDEIMLNVIFCGLGAIFAAIGAGCMYLPAARQRKKLALTRYALTDQRALIYDGVSIEDWPITGDMEIEIHPGSPGSIIFGQEPLDLEINGRPAYRDVGFIGITDLVEVGNMIRDLQSQQITKAEATS